MAKSFLNSLELHDGLRGLQPSGMWLPAQADRGLEFSDWLESRLLARLSESKEWPEVGAIALGSWARRELCPCSDIDLLLIGSESQVLSFVAKQAAEGLRLRYRMPLNQEDWTEGVEAFDVLGILHARALDHKAEHLLKLQQEKIKKRGSAYLRSLVKSMYEERNSRHSRYDSISNYLEPNLKYGPGGLRDLQQAYYLFDLFPQKFRDELSEHSLEIFEKYRQFLLTLRRRLHLMGSGDSVIAAYQQELASWFGYSDVKNFMRNIQLALGRVNFYADWMMERVRASQTRLNEVEEQSLAHFRDCFSALEKDSSRLMQARVRSLVQPLSQKIFESETLGKSLSKYFHVDQSEEYLVALFKSRLMDFCVTELQRVAGLVQHDQYHRFTLDAHLLQAIRVVRRIYSRPQLLGRLRFLVKEMTPLDWRILLWTALYHDLGKGLAGDHSLIGAQLVKRDFIQLKLPLRLTVETAWMVERHLELSTAAFRMNSQATSTWQKLYDKGIKGRRLKRLTLFTAIDILATNPSAWTDWKERLLEDLYKAMSSNRADKFVKLLEVSRKNKQTLSADFVLGLDPSLVEQIPNRYLIKDFSLLNENQSNRDLEVTIWRVQENEYWLRFHSHEDRSGLFLEWTRTLYVAGCQIMQALVHTYEKYGAYDWFQVKSSRSASQLRRSLALVNLKRVKLPEVKFDRVKLVSRDEKEAVISFRGKDRPGLLLKAAQAIAQESCSIRWAKASTWGRQVDDVFGIELVADLEKRVEKIARHATESSA